ncbi:MAG: DUF488 family protein [Chitinivibrionales bacterium]|nr:DUF488 family protein [Chitinivibrionales bacterium]
MVNKTRLFTIGFTQKSAQHFFSSLAGAGVKRVIDIRLNNVSQLAGFAKRDDLAYFLRTLCGIDYIHRPDFAPTKELLDSLKKNQIDWDEFGRQFLRLTERRQIEKEIDLALLDHACLLCSEPAGTCCHRRLVAEYLQTKRGALEICHL